MTERTKQAIRVACAALGLPKPTPATLAMIESAYVNLEADSEVRRHVNQETHRQSREAVSARAKAPRE